MLLQRPKIKMMNGFGEEVKFPLTLGNLIQKISGTDVAWSLVIAWREKSRRDIRDLENRCKALEDNSRFPPHMDREDKPFGRVMSIDEAHRYEAKNYQKWIETMKKHPADFAKTVTVSTPVEPIPALQTCGSCKHPWRKDCHNAACFRFHKGEMPPGQIRWVEGETKACPAYEKKPSFSERMGITAVKD